MAGTTSRLIRLNPDGTADSTFGGTGAVDILCPEQASGIHAVDTDLQHRVIAAGTITIPPRGKQVLIVRHNADGTPDTSIGDKGRVIVQFEYHPCQAVDMTEDPDGIFALVFVEAGDRANFGLVKLRHTGQLDETFGSGGRVVTSFGPAPSEPKAFRFHNRGIVAVGEVLGVLRGPEIVALRWRFDGTLDPTFGENGRVRLTVQAPSTGEPGNSQATDLFVDGAGNVLVVGSITFQERDTEAAAARWTAEGSLDQTFHNDGKVLVNFPGGSSSATAVAQRQSGIVVAARVEGDRGFGLAKRQLSGPPDTTFGNRGFVIDPVIDNGRNVPHAVVIAGQDRILAAGEADGHPVVVRYTSSGERDDTFGQGGRVVFLGGNPERVIAMTRDAAERIVLATVVSLPS
jgi:uncharacterized delta-60 repeat protein